MHCKRGGCIITPCGHLPSPCSRFYRNLRDFDLSRTSVKVNAFFTPCLSPCDRGYTPSYPVETYPQSGYAGGGIAVNPSGGSKIIKQERDKPQKTRHTCTLCKGSGRYERNDGSVPLYGGSDYKVRCQECGYEHYRSTNHRHVNCPQCYGRGYKEY